MQKANNITGQLIYIRTRNDVTQTVTYDLSGSVWEGYMSLYMKSKDCRFIAYGSTLLKVEYGGFALKGPHCFRNFKNDQVSTIDLAYKRAHYQQK